MSGRISEMLRRAADFFDRTETVRERIVPASEFLQSHHERRLDPRDEAGFNRRLVEFRERNARAVDALMTGSVQILGLGELHKRFGARWEEMKFKAYRVAEAAIENRLSKLDLYVVVNEEYYVILFANLSKEEAERRARLIAADIGHRLCGTVPWGASVTVRGVALKVDPQHPLEEIQTLDDLIACMGVAEAEADAKEQAEFEALRGELKLRYRPTLNAAKRLVSAYEAVPERRYADGTWEALEVPADPGTGRFEYEVDMLVLAEIGRHLRRIDAPAERSIVWLPLHWETLAIRTRRDRYTEQFRLLPPQSRRRIMPYLVDLSPDTPQSRLREVVHPVWPLSLGFMARVPLAVGDGRKLSGAGLAGLVVDGSGFTEVDGELRHRLGEFATWARTLYLRPAITEVRTLAVANAATKAGFEYINGPAFLRAIERPQAGRPVGSVRPGPPAPAESSGLSASEA